MLLALVGALAFVYTLGSVGSDRTWPDPFPQRPGPHGIAKTVWLRWRHRGVRRTYRSLIAAHVPHLLETTRHSPDADTWASCAHDLASTRSARSFDRWVAADISPNQVARWLEARPAHASVIWCLDGWETAGVTPEMWSQWYRDVSWPQVLKLSNHVGHVEGDGAPQMSPAEAALWARWWAAGQGFVERGKLVRSGEHARLVAEYRRMAVDVAESPWYALAGLSPEEAAEGRIPLGMLQMMAALNATS